MIGISMNWLKTIFLTDFNAFIRKKHPHPDNLQDLMIEKSIRVMLLISFFLVLVLAVASPFNAHPDECRHISVVQFYIRHWLPPAIGYQESLYTYSEYGCSYINFPGIEYILMGKFVRLTKIVGIPEFLAMRLFNVVLYLLIVIVAIRRMRVDIRSGLVFAPLLLTPQVWYIFSYINNDAFAFFLMICAATEVTFTRGPLLKFLSCDQHYKQPWGAVRFGILLGIMLLSKMNYFFFILYLALFSLLHLGLNGHSGGETGSPINWWRSIIPQKHLILKLLFIIGIALSIVVTRYAYDISLNGLDRKAKIMALQEQQADKIFKSSTLMANPAQSYFGLNLKSKGVSFRQLFSKRRWGTITFQSFVGRYGWMVIFSPEKYYTSMMLLYCIYFLLLFSTVCLHQGWRPRLIFIAMMTVSALTVFISAYYSWVSDFQPQGRYLFPILGMVGMVLWSLYSRLRHGIFIAITGIIFTLSTYSFVFVAMRRLIK